ncbi:hypothetical protein TSTA_012330 [Talaromyces stipitatus ATCC 10500]|uniref:Uncharacterized protein n=1 Tax=Talaromyces stipitatus (strain ATCC 10500 / CBS 375.48 / QM 6759 / NRRL 1006) TaxID=441959 RepID=B8MF25_TALSN|nr:uncharacterized protein TSTA_012330 [Talaromyces stipitatus ATCC 10500]EED16124.1 hypothetical protein TSTA_012330 [Talaromyces stipitatus ATCC 10500]
MAGRARKIRWATYLSSHYREDAPTVEVGILKSGLLWSQMYLNFWAKRLGKQIYFGLQVTEFLMKFVTGDTPENPASIMPELVEYLRFQKFHRVPYQEASYSVKLGRYVGDIGFMCPRCYRQNQASTAQRVRYAEFRDCTKYLSIAARRPRRQSQCPQKMVSHRDLIAVNHETQSHNLEILCPPKTDILYKPAIPDKARPFQFTAPIYKLSMPAGQFKRASVTITFNSNSFVEFDQAGLLFLRPHAKLPNPTSTNEGDAETSPGFVKIGPEVFQDRMRYAVSGSNHTIPDWSLWPVPDRFARTVTVSVEMVRHGPLLGAFVVERDGANVEKTLIRTVPWCFDDIADMDSEVWVGVYAARPDLDGASHGAPLQVRFSEFEIESTTGVLKFQDKWVL